MAERPARHGCGAQPDRHSRLRRAERDQPLRLPRSDDGGRDRRLQFRRELGRRPHRVAARRGARRGLRRSDGPSRGAADLPRTCSRRSRTAHIWKRFTRIATRYSTRWSPTARSSTTASTPCRRGRGLASNSTRRRITEIPGVSIRRRFKRWRVGNIRQRRVFAPRAKCRSRAARHGRSRRPSAAATGGHRRRHRRGRRPRISPALRCRRR